MQIDPLHPNPPQIPGNGTHHDLTRTLPQPDDASIELTYLDPIETTEGRTPSLIPAELPTPHGYSSFRHSGWAADRARTYIALKQAEVPPKRLQRFCDCGSRAYVQTAQDEIFHVRVTCNRCRDRWCVSCQNEIICKLRLNIIDKIPNQTVRFLTLTRKHSGRTLREQIDDIYRFWRNFRARKAIKPNLRGGITFLEIKPSEATGQWHVHLHILFTGKYLAKEVISREWHATTGDSFIIDIRKVGDMTKAVGYVAKYAMKLVPAAIRKDATRFLEVIQALEGRRIMQTFGDWTHFGLHKSVPSKLAWITFGEFSAVLEAAHEGDVIAIDIMKHLTLMTTLRNNATIIGEESPLPDG